MVRLICSVRRTFLYLIGVILIFNLASIPSPSSSSFHIGPIELRAYGLMIALGVLVAIWWCQKRWENKGGKAEEISEIMIWAVPFGLIGARLYHVITDWRSFRGRWEDVPAIWQGGLGIPGGLILGVIVGVGIAKKKGINTAKILDAVIPSIPIAQAIGRWGNWFNQELFGKPTELPWALEIDVQHRPKNFITESTFHPTFLYEAVWNVLLAFLLARCDRARLLKPGRLIGLWILGYGLGRLWVESLRIDNASLIFGVRVNIWMSLVAVVSGLLIVASGRERSVDSMNS
ncbi:MAG: prolipoprotein diacylglyceryl transferase [Acidimicrobiaceae bacterium]|nr:prolipoprotein diacylglyceryl transferase [Acidimicrobiaceae bacterium]